MGKTSKLSALLVVAALLPAGAARGQFAEDGFVRLLSQYDFNGNGLLDSHERAALAAASREQEAQPLSAFPLICEAQAPGGLSGASASAELHQQQSPQFRQVAQHVQLRHRQFAENQPPEAAEPDDQQEQESTDGYAPAPPPPAPRQPVRIRNAVQYRMALNEQQSQPRSQPFAQAATFGPMVGRVKHYPRPYFGVTAHVGCACSRASLYLARY
jgi:hypothetical protein